MLELNSLNNKKRLAKNSLILYLRTIITLALGFVTSRYVLNVLGVDDFGIYNVIGGFVAMFTIVSGTLTFTTQRFITFELGKEDGSPQDVFSISTNINLWLILILIVVGETIGLWFVNTRLNLDSDRMFSVNCVYQISMLTFAIYIYSVTYNALVIAHERMDVFAYNSIIEAGGKFILIIILPSISGDKLILWASSLMLISILVLILVWMFCKKHFSECNYAKVKDKNLYTQIFSFAKWNFIGTLSGTLNSHGTNILANIYFGVQVNAARGVTTQIESSVTSFLNNFTTALNPQIIKAYACKNFTYLNTLIMYGAKLSFFLLMLVAIPIFLEAEIILKLWLGNPPEYAYIFVKILMLYLLSHSLSNTLITAMFATGQLKAFEFVCGTMSGMTFILSYILFYMGWPAESSYITSLLMSVAMMMLRLHMLGQILPINKTKFIFNVALRCYLVFGFTLIFPLTIFMNMDSSIFRLIILTASSAIASAITVLTLGFNSHERHKVLSLFVQRVKRCDTNF